MRFMVCDKLVKKDDYFNMKVLQHVSLTVGKINKIQVHGENQHMENPLFCTYWVRIHTHARKITAFIQKSISDGSFTC